MTCEQVWKDNDASLNSIDTEEKGGPESWNLCGRDHYIFQPNFLFKICQQEQPHWGRHLGGHPPWRPKFEVLMILRRGEGDTVEVWKNLRLLAHRKWPWDCHGFTHLSCQVGYGSFQENAEVLCFLNQRWRWERVDAMEKKTISTAENFCQACSYL